MSVTDGGMVIDLMVLQVEKAAVLMDLSPQERSTDVSFGHSANAWL